MKKVMLKTVCLTRLELLLLAAVAGGGSEFIEPLVAAMLKSGG